MFWRITIALFCTIFVLSTPACIRPHRAPVSQGNLLRDEDIARLKVGMTHEQVIFLVGQPILSQPFDKSRWDYVFMSRRGYDEPTSKNLVLIFNGDKLVKIDNQYPGAQPIDEIATSNNEE